MSDKDNKTPLEQAWGLDEDPQKLTEFYQAWAQTYDHDLAIETYHSPLQMVCVLDAVLAQVWPQADKQNIKVLDAGCGTGLLGQQLFDAAYRNLHGFDLSPEMIEQAQQKGLYDELTAGVDVTQSLLGQMVQSEFDMTVCVGVLTQGHVPPSGVHQLIEITRAGGLIALSASDSYVKDYAFDYFCEQLAEQGLVQNLYKEEGPLVGDTKGLFVVMQKN